MPDATTLVERLGAHPATQLGLDLDTPRGLDRWLLMALLLGTRTPEAAALEGTRALLAAGLLDSGSLDPDSVLVAMTSSPWKQAEVLAVRLARIAHNLAARGGVDALRAESDDLESLGTALTRLGPGLGNATVLRFLRPLRRRWAAASEVPHTPAALAAAVCLGWAMAGDQSFHLPHESPPEADVEAALERLGIASCRATTARHCPLGPRCPRDD